MHPCGHLISSAVLILALKLSASVASGESAGEKFYQIVNGKVDVRTYNGFRRYHAGCNHCHGPDGMGSTVAPSLIEHLPPIEDFRGIVRKGVTKDAAVMKGFAADPNVSPFTDDIYAYLQARSDGVLGRGRPPRLER